MPFPVCAIALQGLMLVARPQASGEDTGGLGDWALAQSQGSRLPGEYQIKARYLSVLPEYIQWPPGSGMANRQLVIGVMGESPFENHLDELFSPGKPQAKKGKVLYLPNTQGLEACDVLFIPESESDRLFEILRKVKGRPVLTIGDSSDFARRGVMVNLVLERDRVRLEINLTSLRDSGLKVSGHILKNAKIIE
jgi:hypothetical protein